MIKFFLCLSLFVTASCSSIGGKEPTDAQINAEALKAYQEVRSKAKISNNAEATAMLNRVASRIAKASGEKFQWEWMLIESPEVNAWCMPGGKMAVYTGILPVLKTEAAMAAVLGHEVAHATMRHGKKQYARSIKQNVVGLVIGGATVVAGQLLCKTQTCKTLTGLGGAAAGFALQFFNMKFSRGDETEADQVGQRYMAQAGYEPSEAIRLWERMGAASKGKAPPEFMSTHPSDEHRRAALQGWLPQAEALYSRAPEQYGLGQSL
jgi:predicted Zn-dependent protease